MLRISACVIALGAFLAVTAAHAQECWEDVTTNGCEGGEGGADFHQIQLRNTCSGGTVNVCVKWTSGDSAGVVNRFAGYAGAGEVATITPGMCQNGDLQYTYNTDGSVPDCP